MKQRSAGKPDIETGKQIRLRRVEQQIASAREIHPKDLKSYEYPKFVYKEYQIRWFLDSQNLRPQISNQSLNNIVVNK